MNHFLRELEKTTKTGCWQYTIENKALVWSDHIYQIHKVEVGKVIKVEDAISYYHDEDKEVISKLFVECIENKKSYKIDLRILDSNGETVNVEASGKPLLTEDGDVYAVFGTFRDLSEVSILKNEVKSMQRNYNHFYQALNQSFLISDTDENGVITYANDNFCKLVGYKQEEIIGQKHTLFSSGKHPRAMFNQMWKQLLSGKPWEGLICNKKKNGELFWQQSLIFPKVNSSGEIKGFSSIKTDATEKVLTQLKLEEEVSKNTFAAQLAAVGEISAGVAHEIANPLTIISFKNDSLESIFNDKEEINKTQLVISKAITRISKIIKGLQRLSRRTEAELFENVCLSYIMTETLEFCHELLKSNNIKLHFEDIPTDIFIECDEIKISQIILNLINNAKDAINEAKLSKEKWIMISFENFRDHITLKVSDSGDGIPPEISGKFMESFITTKVTGKGTGLGLALVNRFVGEHQGLFYLDDQKQNTCFVIEIPKQQVLQKAA